MPTDSTRPSSFCVVGSDADGEAEPEADGAAEPEADGAGSVAGEAETAASPGSIHTARTSCLEPCS
ncbi:MAG: hypothetical protein DMD78_11810 [Candidatus Rokuibacteriota bacterium]|nr:MAG: hypothetical protein DMD78_11810 [Candidatus Rokubacteria bacterium]